MAKTREDYIMESYYKQEISRAYMLCLISDDCGRCTTCHIDNESDPVFYRRKSNIPVVEEGVIIE